MSFCVECGKEGATFEGVCADDFRRKHTLVRAPEVMDVVRCQHCGHLKPDGGWVEADVEDVLLDLLAARVERDPGVTRAQYTYDLLWRDERTADVVAKAVCTVGPWEIVDSLSTTLRVQGGVCPTCSRKRGKYYVGTVQVRADGRELTTEEEWRAREFAAHGESGREFVARVEEVRGGIDILVSSNTFARRLARNLAREMDGTVGSSATLHTRKEGKDAYRATYVVRLAGFRAGDTILWRRARYRVLSAGEPMQLERVETGEKVTARRRTLRGARILQP